MGKIKECAICDQPYLYFEDDNDIKLYAKFEGIDYGVIGECRYSDSLRSIKCCRVKVGAYKK